MPNCEQCGKEQRQRKRCRVCNLLVCNGCITLDAEGYVSKFCVVCCPPEPWRLDDAGPCCEGLHDCSAWVCGGVHVYGRRGVFVGDKFKPWKYGNVGLPSWLCGIRHGYPPGQADREYHGVSDTRWE